MSRPKKVVLAYLVGDTRLSLKWLQNRIRLRVVVTLPPDLRPREELEPCPPSKPENDGRVGNLCRKMSVEESCAISTFPCSRQWPSTKGLPWGHYDRSA